METHLHTELSGRVFEYTWTCLLGFCDGVAAIPLDRLLTTAAFIPRMARFYVCNEQPNGAQGWALCVRDDYRDTVVQYNQQQSSLSPIIMLPL
jgi:hypothetical protein